MSKFNVGDRVRIKEDLIGGLEYGGVYFSEYMEEYRGLEAVVFKIAYENNYTLSVGRDWYWSDEMLEKAEETVTIRKSDYDKLIHDSKLLNCLEACGVDNWNEYDEAHEMMEEEGE